jgi:hypothetical protein
MYLVWSLGVASFVISSVQAAVSSTGFTVSLTDVDYFLPPKPIAKISGCEEIKSSFEDALFVPFTVVKAQGNDVSVASLTASYAQDDVWQEGFLEGVPRSHLPTILTDPVSQQYTSKEAFPASRTLL